MRWETQPAFRFVTGSLKVALLKPTPLAGPFEIRGRVKEIKGRKVVVETSVLVAGTDTARGKVAVQLPEHFGAERVWSTFISAANEFSASKKSFTHAGLA